MLATTIDLIGFDGFRANVQDAVSAVIKKRLEENEFPGGGLKVTLNKRAKERSRLPGLHWRSSNATSEQVIVVTDDEPNLGYHVYVMVQKSAKAAMKDDPKGRPLKGYLTQLVISLPPKMGPASRIITEELFFGGAEVLVPSQEQPVVEEVPAPAPIATPAAKRPEQPKEPKPAKLSDSSGKNASFGTSEVMGEVFVASILDLYMVHWESLDETERRNGIQSGALAVAFEKSHLKVPGKEMSHWIMGRVLTGLANVGLLQKVPLDSVIRAYYPCDYKVDVSLAKKRVVVRKASRPKGTKPASSKTETPHGGVIALTAERIRSIRQEDVEVTALIQKHEAALQTREREQSELESEQETLRERLTVVNGRLSELKAEVKDLKRQGHDLESRQANLKPLIEQIAELRKALE